MMLSRVERKVKNATAEKHELQAQLRETISTYTQTIEQLHEQLNRAGPDAKIQWQLHDAKAAMIKMQQELGELEDKLVTEFPDGLGQYSEEAKAAQASAEEETLKAEVEQLRKSITALAGDAVNNVQIDNSRAAELTRLRRDVQMLNGEKEGLETNLQEADKEKQNLIDNFLTVKKDLDNLQMASLSSPAASPEMERHLAALRMKHEQALEEKNRVAAKLEAIDAEREKQKQQRDAALERVMVDNARLLEERDRMDKEKARISALYQETMGALGAGPQAAVAASPVGADGSALSIDALAAEIKTKSELLVKRQEESESLRSRLRKLAMV